MNFDRGSYIVSQENLRDYMLVHVVGANGCGNVAISDGLKDFPLGCWQDFPFGDSEEARAQARTFIAPFSDVLREV